MKIAILGGGISGVALARMLAADGHGVTVLEKSDRASIVQIATITAFEDHDVPGMSASYGAMKAAALRNMARVLGWFGASPIVPEHYKLADSDFVLDIRAAKDALGWTPKYDNARMLAQAYDWYVSLADDVRPPQHPVLRLLNGAMPSFTRRP